MIRQALLPFFNWYGNTALAQTMANSSVLIALSQIVHLIGMTLLIGTVMMVDFSLLGFGFKRHPVARVARELAPWTRAGLAILLISGVLNLSSEAQRCYDSSFFWIKMGLLMAAIAFHFTVHRRVALAEPPVAASRAGIVACISLALWFGTALAAKFIGFYGEDLRVRVSAPTEQAVPDLRISS